MFQLMPPRGGNHHDLGIYEMDCKVSTHAPARGQSYYFISKMRAHFLFQLMPPRGGNPNSVVKAVFLNSFNSCPREGAIWENVNI